MKRHRPGTPSSDLIVAFGFRYLAKNFVPLLFVQKGPWLGWIFQWTATKGWVSLKPADKRDLQQIALRIAIGN